MKKLLFITAAALGAVLSSSAATISYVDTFGPEFTDFTQSVSLPKFDPSFGTLTQVSYDLEATVDGLIQADSENPTPTTVVLTLSAVIDLFDASTSTLLLSVSSSASSGPTTLSADTDGFPVDYVGTDAVSFPALISVLDSTTITDSSLFGDWIATFLGETFNLDVIADGLSLAIGSGNLATSARQIVNGTVTVNYDYSTVVPEPGTYLSMVGLLGVAAVAGRRLVRR